MSVEMYVVSVQAVPVTVVDRFFGRNVFGVSTGSTGGCCG